MGTSRDFTTGSDQNMIAAGGTTAVLERGVNSKTRQGRSATRLGETSSRTRDRDYSRTIPRRVHRPTLYRREAQPTGATKRLGSKQVVSRRGWRTTPIKKSQRFSRVSAVAITLLIAGVALAVWFSGLSTAQTFKVQNLTVQESQLGNQLETLNRDLENVRSTADIAHRAADKNMGVPTQPGIIETKDDGGIDTRRDPEPGQESIIDVNGEPVRPGRASSDPNSTKDVSGNLEATPEGENKRTESGGDEAAAERDATEHRGGRAPQNAEKPEKEEKPADNEARIGGDWPGDEPRPNVPAPAPYEPTTR